MIHAEKGTKTSRDCSESNISAGFRNFSEQVPVNFTKPAILRDNSMTARRQILRAFVELESNSRGLFHRKFLSTSIITQHCRWLSVEFLSFSAVRSAIDNKFSFNCEATLFDTFPGPLYLVNLQSNKFETRGMLIPKKLSHKLATSVVQFWGQQTITAESLYEP